MKKIYKAMGAMSLALITAFISLQGVDAIRSMASPLENTCYSYTETSIHTDSNANNGRDMNISGSSETTNNSYGEWIIIKEPTLSEDGLKKREYIASDGTRYEEYEIIPRLVPDPMPLPLPSIPMEPQDPRPVEPIIPEPTEPTVPDKKEDFATKSNAKKYSRHSSSGKKKRIIESNDVKETSKTFNSTNNIETTIETTKSFDTKNNQTEKTVENNVKTGKKHPNIESAESKNDMSSITSGIDDNVENSIIESSETTIQIMTEKIDSTKEREDKVSNKVEQKSGSEIIVDTVVSKDQSFNRYDGVTLLAAGAYTWWIAIVLLPMVNALKWINKKRREKARNNVNKKYN